MKELWSKRKIDALGEEAARLKAHAQYAEAAEIYARLAVEYLDENALIYAGYCHDAFNMWLKAKNIENALQQANNAFQVLDDGGWLKRSMEQVLDLKQMIAEMNEAGFPAEADSFADKLNNKLAEFGLMLRPVSSGKMPSICPACGAPLPHSYEGETKCSFCGYVIRAI
jgi:hypothetical protein